MTYVSASVDGCLKAFSCVTTPFWYLAGMLPCQLISSTVALLQDLSPKARLLGLVRRKVRSGTEARSSTICKHCPITWGALSNRTLLACYAVSRWSCCRNIFQSALPDLPHQRRKVILVTSMNTTVASFVKAASCMVTAISVCWRERCPVALSRLPGCVLQSFPF